MPDLRGIFSHLSNLKAWRDFLRLVEEFIPESLAEIREANPRSLAIALFARDFAAKYFPLPDYVYDWDYLGEEEALENLLSDIPFDALGFTYYDETIREWSTPLQILSLFCRDSELVRHQEEGEILLWHQGLAGVLPVALIKEIWSLSLDRAHLHWLLDGTPYAEVAAWFDRVENDTGIILQDVTREDYPGGLSWTRNNVTLMQMEYGALQEWDRRLDTFTDQLMLDPTTRCREILAFLSEQRQLLDNWEDQEPPPPRPLIEVFATPPAFDFEFNVPFLEEGGDRGI
jgi:hypothetical protein